LHTNYTPSNWRAVHVGEQHSVLILPVTEFQARDWQGWQAVVFLTEDTSQADVPSWV
jgi:hypothetical protein